MTTMPSDSAPRHKAEPVITPASTFTTVDTAAGTVTVKAGTEQYPTEDHGLTAPRPIVAFWIGDQKTTVQIPAAEAETVGRALMFAAVQATNLAEEVTTDA